MRYEAIDSQLQIDKLPTKGLELSKQDLRGYWKKEESNIFEWLDCVCGGSLKLVEQINNKKQSMNPSV